MPGKYQDPQSLCGRLRWKVSLEAHPEPEQQDAAGEPIEMWELFATTWAEVLCLGGRELLYAQQVQAETTHLVTIRWRPWADRKMRVVTNWGEILYVNAAVDPDNTRYQLKLYCTAPK